MCREPFSIAPPKRIDILADISGVTAEMIKARRPVLLPAHRTDSAANRLAHTRCPQEGMLLVASESASAPLSANIPSEWEVFFQSRRAHWAKSVYFIYEVGARVRSFYEKEVDYHAPPLPTLRESTLCEGVKQVLMFPLPVP